MDYGAAILATVTDKASKEFGQVQTAALLKATGCIGNSSLESFEVISNCFPVHLRLKLRQAEEVVKVFSKHDTKLIKEKFDTYLNNEEMKGKKHTFKLLMSVFVEWK